ncbi:uncharacterized protein LOC124280343 [Haliotis rubra]|uniref:uncharacterized protein LOC124280343 n=1 Tax=Haliotis rubra TaxID=36100 RepID=UPI001EE5246C|nr:uncharacterized protein LOC124280343 [Haliotis rubra]XP_046572204.1 uncharacterized protein LOC124280343 [Haliotis rubra]
MLIAGAPPFIVHYLWCRKGYFEFKHYLSILSVVQVVRPDWIVFHYTHLPVTDRKGYVTWFNDIQRDIPFLSFKKLPHTRYCGHTFFDKSDFVLSDYVNPAGVFISDEVAVVDFTKADYLKMVLSSNFMHVRAFLLPASEPHVVTSGRESQIFDCPSIQEYNKYKSGGIVCVQLTDRLSPADIWHQKKPFYEFARNLTYGSPDPIDPSAVETSLVPLHCHILHVTSSPDLDVTAYASILSALYVAKMQHVFIHGPIKPSGRRWDQLSKHNVSFIPVTHMSDWHPEIGDMIYGAYVLLRHGGIVVRSDTIWRKEFPSDLRKYTSIATLRRSIYRIINYSVDLNVLISKPKSKFLKSFITRLKQAPARHLEAKSEEIAYRTYVDVPTVLKMDTNLLQHVVCSKGLCQPRPEDMAAGRSLLVQLEWKDGAPGVEGDLDRFRGPGVDTVKAALRQTV